MINSRHIFLLIISGIFLVAGCRKQAAISSGSFTTNKVKMAISTSSTGVSDTFVYMYDSIGRLMTAQTDTVVTAYTYMANTVTVATLLAGQTFLNNYDINMQGLATSDSKGFVYSYDSAGYLIAMSYTLSSKYDSTLYTITNGDVDTIIEHQADAATNNVITTTYTFLTKLDNRIFGLNFLGNQNKYLVSTKNISQNLNGSIYTTAYIYSYIYDSGGRVSQQIESSGSATYTTTYSYY
jgi:hypothetical protein